MSRRLGQHFLTDRHALARIADALALTGSETVIEIGPGRGALTELLLARAARVVAIELDDTLVAHLHSRFAGDPRLTVVAADVLDVALAGAASGAPFVLAGNVPYYITTPILFHALEPPMPERSVFLVQKEVAERVVAEPGSKIYGALSVNVQALAVPRLVAKVPPAAFSPPPKVESAILAMEPLAEPLITAAEQSGFSEMVIAAFGLRRKQMRRVVRTLADLLPDAANQILNGAGIDAESRPETLTPGKFVSLYRQLANVST
ncbi:MAG TPA: 16S rRNA (adenine(1518)-N(6)/adenine(1519)-N(6))-dimethyltransferase RsmA [Gemmatimonadaceae bacterium]|nr:16S rRNA (adenine(1518)-N(6)/adenine(1519)-N(6))-dimethyltransferase RsmA [Gemmatimonadaceae bacterium]